MYDHISMNMIMSKESFIASFSIWMFFSSFSCLIALARTSNLMLKRIVESGNLFILPNLKGKAFSMSPLSIILPVGFLCKCLFIFFLVKEAISYLLRVFIMHGDWLLSNVFSIPIKFFAQFERNTLMAFREVWAKGRIGRPFRKWF